eukprot:8798442-Lingulodinium_polyedra.AAC.1
MTCVWVAGMATAEQAPSGNWAWRSSDRTRLPSLPIGPNLPRRATAGTYAGSGESSRRSAHLLL